MYEREGKYVLPVNLGGGVYRRPPRNSRRLGREERGVDTVEEGVEKETSGDTRW